MNIPNQTILFFLIAALALLAFGELTVYLCKTFSPSARRTRFYLHLYNCLKNWDPSQGPIPQELQDLLDLIQNIVHDEKPTQNPMIYWLYGMVFMMEDKPWYDYAGVMETLQKRAEENDPECQFLLGNFQKRGGKGFEADPVTGEDWIRKAKQNGVSIKINEY